MATLDRLAPPTPALPAEIPAWTPRRAIAVALALVAAIALLQVLQSSSVASTGESMQRLERERAQKTAEIHQLEKDVAALSSLDRIDRNARERLGMVPARRFEYVSVNTEAPTVPLLPRPIIDSTPIPEPQSEPWWQSLIKALPLP
ncbi:MAG: septum formation initiator family protein [Dehalococcoidia bacterium]